MTAWLENSAVVHWLWHATWEASVVAVAVLAVQALFRRKLTARWSFALWWLVVIRLVLPAGIPVSWSAFSLCSARLDRVAYLKMPAAGPTQPVLTRQVANGMPLTVPEPGFLGPVPGSADAPAVSHWLAKALVLVWLLGVAVMGVRLWRAKCRLRGLLRDARESHDRELRALVDDCARLMGLARGPRLLLTRVFQTPALVGWFRPKLLLPETLRGVLTGAEMRHIFLHELAHIRRRDLALNGLLCGLEALHWFNPILRYSFRRIQADRELACDALALSRMQPAEKNSYGQTVLKLLESLTSPATVPGLVGLLEQKQQMKRRIEMIACKPSKNHALAAGLFAALGIFTLTDAQTANPTATDSRSETATSEQAPTDTTAAPELLKQEREIDKQHLQRIYRAIQNYYKDRKDLPNWLSDLVPQYLADANDLVSPIEKRTGKSVLFGRDDPKLHTSYIYEFNAAPAPEEFNKGRAVPVTCKEWKLMQLQKFGMVTPILRSHIDQPVLNVAYSGQIYDTGLLWENDPNTLALIRKNPRLGPQQDEPGGARLTVHVVDATTGAAVPGATVRDGIGSEFGLLPPGQANTGANGDVAVPLGEWKVNFLFLTATREGYYPAGTQWNRDTAQEDSPPAEMTLKLTPKPGN